jgi:hypothetical protein
MPLVRFSLRQGKPVEVRRTSRRFAHGWVRLDSGLREFALSSESCPMIFLEGSTHATAS